ncbi:helix-turn-helix domain-containing protein [Candidatus Latescibacterota bacterium]
MKPIHEELKEIRLEKGVSLKNISSVTKIRIHFLESLEKGDFSFLPKPYIRAFLYEYAEAIEIDPELVLARLDKKIDSIAHVHSAKEKIPPSQRSTPKKRSQKSKKVTIDIGKQDKPSEKIMNNLQEPEIISQEDNPLNKYAPQPSDEKQPVIKTHSEDGLKTLSSDDYSIDKPEIEIDDKQLSFFSDKDLITHQPAEKDEKVFKEEDSVTTTEPRKSLIVVAPESSNRLFFVIFFILILLSGIIIFLINRGGLF